MTSSGASILTTPPPCGHIVYPYTDEVHIAEAVCLFASAGLRKGEAVILIMTSSHCPPIRRRLEEEGFDLNALQASGQLSCEDAGGVLATCLANGGLDEAKFKRKVGEMIERAKASGEPAGRRPVRVFGEMVELLWRTELQTTERLEELWNELIEAHSVPLLCAYSLAGTKPDALPASLLACHSHHVAAA